MQNKVHSLLVLIALIFLSNCSNENSNKSASEGSKSMSKIINNPVVYFEIPVTDMDRAVIFYEKVFGHKLERTVIDGNEMALFANGNVEFGISGALAKGDSYVPGPQGARIYFKTFNIDDSLQKAVNAGGKINYPKTSVGDLGLIAEFIDSEGNIIALHAEQSAH